MLPFEPEKLPLNLEKFHWNKLIQKVSSASSSLAYYDGVLGSMINPGIFLSPLETKEAILSSRIEGTVTTLDEVLKFEADIKPGNATKENDIVEVLNYRKATRFAKDWIKREMPFNLTMVCAIQKELMIGVRGTDKFPGEIRKEQVWIGPRNCKIEDATYIPPEPLGLSVHLDNFLSYLRINETEPLIQTAIMHAQFEIIHPFMDGNGRTGRILIPLYLWYRKRLSSPVLYISEFFDDHRDDYVDLLLGISKEGKWEEWICFFLEAIDVQARKNAEKANQVRNLYSEMKGRIPKISNSPNGIKVIDALFQAPIFRSTTLRKLTGINQITFSRILSRLKQEKILSTIQEASGSKPEILLFDELYALINR